MTIKERAKTVTDEVGTATTGAELRALIEQSITAAIEEEREECAKIVDEARERITANNYQADVGRRFATGIAAQIRARSTASRSAERAVK